MGAFGADAMTEEGGRQGSAEGRGRRQKAARCDTPAALRQEHGGLGGDCRRGPISGVEGATHSRPRPRTIAAAAEEEGTES